MVHYVNASSILSVKNGMNVYRGCSHGCIYCDSRSVCYGMAHPFTDIEVKQNAPELLESALRRKRTRCMIGTGSMSDPYLPLEAEAQITRRCLEIILKHGFGCTVLTKSNLILRDLDLIRSFPASQVAWSINTLDEDFRKEMDRAASIERRLNAMKQFYDAGIQTTCFISPIFPGITDVISIIERVKGQCNQVWLENLNLRGSYRKAILEWIHEHHPELDDLYHEIYAKKSREYWSKLDEEIRTYARKEGMLYVRDDDQHRAPFGEKPVLCNYFYHEEVRKSAKK